jgi:hypothetical protein
MAETAGGNGRRADSHSFCERGFRPEQMRRRAILHAKENSMATFVGPNGRIYRKPRKRWPKVALIAAVLTVAAVTVNAMRPVKPATAAAIGTAPLAQR